MKIAVKVGESLVFLGSPNLLREVEYVTDGAVDFGTGIYWDFEDYGKAWTYNSPLTRTLFL